MKPAPSAVIVHPLSHFTAKAAKKFHVFHLLVLIFEGAEDFCPGFAETKIE
jgi:hypothetical protein